MLARLFRRGATIALLGVTASSAFAQTVVTGIVRDERNSPLAGAGIYVRGTRVSVLTNESGMYRLVVPDGAAESDSMTVIARRSGFEPVTRRVAIRGAATVDFTL